MADEPDLTEHADLFADIEQFLPVSDRLIHVFLDQLGSLEGMESLSKRLRTKLINERSYSEAALREAIFSELEP